MNVNKHYMIENCGQWKNTYNLVFSNSKPSCEIVTTYDINDLLNDYEYCPSHYSPSFFFFRSLLTKFTTIKKNNGKTKSRDIIEKV